MPSSSQMQTYSAAKSLPALTPANGLGPILSRCLSAAPPMSHRFTPCQNLALYHSLLRPAGGIVPEGTTAGAGHDAQQEMSPALSMRGLVGAPKESQPSARQSLPDKPLCLWFPVCPTGLLTMCCAVSSMELKALYKDGVTGVSPCYEWGN